MATTRRTAVPATPTPSESRSGQNSIAGIGGAGSGTLLLTLSNAFPAQSFWHGILMYAAPSFAVLSGAAILLIKVQVESVVQARYINKARETLENQRNQPGITDDYRKELDEALVLLNRTEIIGHMARVKALSFIEK
jgi:hypothetical protein